MKKVTPIFLILTGILIIGFTSYEMIQDKSSQNDALETAKVVLTNKSKKEFSSISKEEEVKQLIPEHFQPMKGDIIGILHIPKLEAELPIIEGSDEEELKIGVGHFSKTGYPTEEKQILLSGHRETVFRNLGELEIGDIFQVDMEYGTYLYEIEETFIVDADDTTVIDYSIDEEVLTVSTCYPFRYIGNAPQRYIINAKPINR